MKPRSLRILTLLIVWLCVPFLASAQTEGTHEIWIVPQSLPLPPLNRDDDFMQLFTPKAAWPEVAAHTQVFGLRAVYLAHAPQDQVNAIVGDLKHRGISIALEVEVLAAPCGEAELAERYSSPTDLLRISQAVKAAGGDVSAIAMDEPLFYGHYYSPKRKCRSGAAQIAELAKPALDILLQQFPKASVGDIEPTQVAAYSNWQNDLEDFCAGFRSSLRRPLAFMQLDVPWARRSPSKEPQDALAFYYYANQLKDQQLIGKIGIIHDGTPLDASDLRWVDDAKAHVVLLETTFGLHPDQEIFASWMENPTRALPESDPDTLTGLALWYLKRSAH